MACLTRTFLLYGAFAHWANSRRMHASSALQQSVAAAAEDSCAPLTNQGSFSSVEVLVGTPPQKFHVVADTGSDSLIVASCACQMEGHCKYGSKCFNGYTSTTFVRQASYEELKITFGSGPINAAVTTDIARVGDASALMSESLLQMTKEDVGMELEGILGLGLPPRKKMVEEASPQMTRWGYKVPHTPVIGDGFFALANVSRFSLCFHDNGADGSLRMGTQVQMDNPLGGIGLTHWGVDFRGISVGSKSVSICDSGNMEPGQVTPCGALPDSGTTLITAPATHLAELFDTLCDQWERCRDNTKMKQIAEDKANLTKTLGQAGKAIGNVAESAVKAGILLDEIASCNLDGLPPLEFHVRGSTGNEQTLLLKPTDYVIETAHKNTKMVSRLFSSLVHVDYKVPEPLDGMETVCIPAFDVMEYPTARNGPVWIFGTPFFYKYTISYDRLAEPPAISFADTPCTPCGRDEPTEMIRRVRTSARRLLGKDALFPRINVSEGL